jgi:hypothetical protein
VRYQLLLVTGNATEVARLGANALDAVTITDQNKFPLLTRDVFKYPVSEADRSG